MSGVPFLVTAVFCTVIALSILWVNPRRVINQVIGLTSFFVSSSFFCVYAAINAGRSNLAEHTPNTLFWLRANGATYAFVPWALWLMKESILSEQVSLFALMRRSLWILLGSLVLAVICFTNSYIPEHSEPGHRLRGMGYVFFTGSMYLLISLIMFGAYRASRNISGVRRIEIQFFLLNACVAGLLVGAITAMRRLHNVPGLTYVPSIAVIGCFCVMMWAVSYHRIFDARQFMVSIGHRIAMLALLALGALGLHDLISLSLDRRMALVLGATIAGVVVFYANQMTRKWLKLDLEQQLLAPRTEIITCTQRESDPDALRADFEKLLKTWCQTDLVTIIYTGVSKMAHTGQFVDEWDFPKLYRQGWTTPEHLQRLRHGPDVEKACAHMTSNGFSAVVVAPRGSEKPSLWIGLGSKYSARPYTYPDIAILLNLAELMDNILTHATLAQHAAKIAQMESAAMISRSLAHDLNNLTTPVAAYLVHAEGRAKPGSVEAEVYEAALDSVKVMNEYICESLFFSRRLVPELKMMSPRESLASILRIAQDRAATRRIALTSRCEEGIRFLADPVLFQRLALNLINNAIDASPDQSSVMVSIDRNHSEQICLRVADQGAGIPSENLKRIFDPYFTTKNTGDTGRGLGLGLAICRKIVDLHGGDIEVDSSPGRGSVFTAIFPRLAKLNYLPASDTESSRERKPAGQPQAVIGFA